MGARVLIYVLLRANDHPFYVGRTTQIALRFRNHKLKFGKRIKWQELDECDAVDAALFEEYWIAKYVDEGWPLLNTSHRRTTGGVVKHTEATRKKMSKARRGNSNTSGHKLSVDHKKKIIVSLMGNKRTLGRKLSAEHAAKLRAGARAYHARQRALR